VSLNGPGRTLIAVFALVTAAALLAAGAAIRLSDGRHAAPEDAQVDVQSQSAGGQARQGSPTDGQHSPTHRDEGPHRTPMGVRQGSPTDGQHSPTHRDETPHRIPMGITTGVPTAEQRAATEELLEEIRRNTWRWEDPDAARALGYEVVHPEKKRRNKHWKNKEFTRDGRILDPRRPEGLFYRDGQLVGVFFKTPRGVEAPQPGGPLMVWHTHEPSCKHRPEGPTCQEAPRMLHAWFDGEEAAFDTASGKPRFGGVSPPEGALARSRDAR
jgi:hypothetical protein